MPGTLSPPLTLRHALGTRVDPPAHAAASWGRAGSSPSCCMAVETAASGIWDVLEGTSCPSNPAGSRTRFPLHPHHPRLSVTSLGQATARPASAATSPHPALSPAQVLTLCSPHTYLLRSWGGSPLPPCSASHQAVSPPVCFASEGCTGVIRGCVTSIFCPASSCFFPLFKAPGADWSCQPEPDIWG